MSRNCASIIARRTPRRRCVGYTPTTVTPPHGSSPPGTENSNGNAPAPPTISPSSNAACIRSNGSTCLKRSSRSSVSSALKYWPIPLKARPYSAASVVGRTSNTQESLELFERRVVEHQPPLRAVVGEAHRDDASRLDAHNDAFAERAVPDAVARHERRDVVARRDLALLRSAVVRPGRGLQTLAFDVALRKLVEKPRGQVVRASSIQHARGR